MRILYLTIFVAVTSMGAVGPSLSIPRDASHRFLSEGIFDGGKAVRANVENLRFSKHNKEGFERWVFDFSDSTTGTTGLVAPQFQVRYLKADKIAKPEGGLVTLAPAKIVIAFKGVSKNGLNRTKIDKLVRKSTLVKEIISYPPIENGDLAIEMVLKDSFPFYTHQPLTQEGRLVVDIAPNS